MAPEPSATSSQVSIPLGDSSHWYVIPSSLLRPVADRTVVSPLQTETGEVIEPAFGSPSHGGSVTPNRMFERVEVLVAVVDVLEQTVASSARYHRLHVPVPKPELVHWVFALVPASVVLLKQVSTTKLSVPFQVNAGIAVTVHPVDVTLRSVGVEVATRPVVNQAVLIGLVLVVV